MSIKVGDNVRHIAWTDATVYGRVEGIFLTKDGAETWCNIRVSSKFVMMAPLHEVELCADDKSTSAKVLSLLHSTL